MCVCNNDLRNHELCVKVFNNPVYQSTPVYSHTQSRDNIFLALLNLPTDSCTMLIHHSHITCIEIQSFRLILSSANLSSDRQLKSGQVREHSVPLSV
jgi:hypothetical protein